MSEEAEVMAIPPYEAVPEKFDNLFIESNPDSIYI